MENNVDLAAKKDKDNISSLFLKNLSKPKNIKYFTCGLNNKDKFILKIKQFTYNLDPFPKINRIPAILICTTCLLLPFYVFFEPAISVSIDYVHIGFCKSKNNLYLAQNLLEQSIKASSGEDISLSKEINFTPSFTINDNILNTNDLIKTISNASDNICMASVITVNDKIIGACSSPEEIDYILNTLSNQYKTSPTDTTLFVQSVNVSKIPVNKNMVFSASALLQKIKDENIIDIQVISTNSYTKTIPYQTKRIETDELEQNTTKTIQFGSEGIASVNEQIITLNGNEVQRRILNTSVITSPTDCIISVGTRSNGIGNGQFITPITGYTFTSAFKIRNGQLHKGVDLAVPVGTAVHAADSGVVEISKLSDSFGNYVVINHQNGFKTLYAHNSVLLVKEGDIISKGQQIALSGNTGNSTGPHLHFEIHSNGVAINPEIYINFGTEN